MSYRILIIGCGQIGSRHLQAVASLPQVREIEVVDPRPDGLALGQERLGEIPDHQPSIKFRWLTRPEEASPGGDLCIVATQAEGRLALVEQAAALGYRAFLVEKLVTQSVSEYERLRTFVQARGLSAWVNLKTRAYPIYKYVKARLEPGRPILYSSVGGNHGLATNGVHAADLFIFLTGADCIESAGARIDPILHHTKRGQYDLSGTLHGHSASGSHFTLSYACDHAQSVLDVLVTGRYRWVVDNMKRQAFEGVATDSWDLRPIPFEGNLLVSHMTEGFAADILRYGRCELPTLAQSFPAHRFILSELLPVFNQLLGKEDDRCPVT